MGNFQGSSLGRLLTLLGFDGTAFRNITVDADGHLQVDALTAQLITGFATETTLDLLSDRIGAIVSPVGNTANWSLQALVEQMEDLLDLRGALDSVDTDELVVNVDESVLPAGAATEASVQGIEDQVKNTLINMDSGYREYSFTVPTGSPHTELFTAVPADHVLHVTNLSLYNDTTLMAKVAAGIKVGAISRMFWHSNTIEKWYPTSWNGHLWLNAGEQIYFYAVGTVNGDTMRWLLHGHLITV